MISRISEREQERMPGGTHEVCPPMAHAHQSHQLRMTVQSSPREKPSTRPPQVPSPKKKPGFLQAGGFEQEAGLGLLLVLEPRIMFDGAAFVTGAEVVQDQNTQDQAPHDQATPGNEIEPETASNPLTDRIDLFSALSTAPPSSDRKELVFIDSRVEDYQTLLNGIDPGAEAVLLDATRDGIEQIAEILHERTDIDAIHLIAEGNAAELHLGTTFLTQESISGRYANLLAQIGQSLSAEADLLIYGCNFGQGEAGLSAIQTLAQLTGADIAASTDRTGHVNEYGNWALEVATGTIETSIVIGEATREAWEGVLATYTVTTTTDGGAGSLRQAILNANANSGTDTITFVGSGTYLLTITGAGEDLAATGDLDITDDLILIGNGTGNTIIDASGFGGTPDRVFHTLGAITATISGVTIQGGDQSNGGGIFVDTSSTLILSNATLTGNNHNGAGSGGAIHVHGTANLNTVVLSGNTADDGGAIGFHNTGTGSLTNVTISGNTATGNGGGLWNDSTITVTNSTISGNSANLGGGIYNDGILDISNTTVSGNMADTGAGIYHDTSGTDLTLTNVTVSGNMATSTGGGLYARQTVTIVNSTFTLNSADSGGGIRTQGGPGTVDLLNTIVAGNTVVSANPDLQGTFTTAGYNLIGDGTGQGNLVDGVNNDQVGSGGSPINPQLGGLAANGGATMTHALLGGSPAIDAGTATGAPAVDQRGVTRDASVDIGAFEVTSNTAPPVATSDTYTIDEDTSLSTEASWFNEAWLSRQRLTFNNTAQTESLMNFPVLITLDAGNIDYTKVQNAGEDLRFVDTDGTELAYEIESWNEAGTSYVWVKVPQIDGASGTDSIWMYYDNAGAADNQNSPGVWATNFEALSHLHNDFTDSTGNAHNGSNNGSLDITGTIGDGQSFDGVDDRIDISSGAGIDNIFSGGATVSAWINPSSWGEGGFGRILDKGDAVAVTNGWALQVESTGNRLIFELGFSGNTGRWRASMNSISLDTWQLVTVAYDSSSAANDPTIYVNGVALGLTESSTPSGTANSDVGLDLAIGNRSASTDRTFQGILDEIRLETTTRSADWIKAQYLSMTNTFVTVAASEGPGGVLTNDTDADSDPLTAIQVSANPANAQSFTLNANGSFSYTPVTNFTGVDTFTYKVNDGTVDGNTVLVTINVNPVNDAPLVATNTGVTVNEASTGTIITTAMLNEGDPDDAGTGLTYTVTAVTTNGTLRLSATALGLNDTFTQDDIDTNRVTYDHNGSETTTDSFSFSLADGGENGSTPATDTFTIMVTPTNDPPTATIIASAFGVNEDDTYRPIAGVSVADSDAGTNDLSVTLSVNDGLLRLVTTTGLTFSSGANDSATMTVTGTTTNLNNSLATLRYQPDPDFAATDLLTLMVDDLGNTGGGSLTAMDTANIVVAPINDPPSFTGLDQTPTFIQGGAAVVLDGNATISDPELDAVNNYNGATLTLTRNGGANAEDVFNSSGTLLPLVESGSVVVGGTTVGTVTTNSSGTLVLTFNGNATTARVNSALQQITYANSSITPPANVQVDFSIDDGNAGAQGSGGALNGNGSITVTINTLNLPPVAVADGFSVNRGTTNILNLAANDSDVDDGLDLTSITIISGPTNGTIDSINVDGTVTYTHNGSATIVDSFTYTIDDLAAATSNTVTVSLTVVNVPPVAVADGFTVNEGSTNTLNLAGNDTDPDDGLDLTSITIVSGPTNGTITSVNADGTVDYTHNGSETVADSFTYTIKDVAGNTSNTVTVSLVVTPQNDAPMITSNGGGATAAITIIEGNTAVTDVNATDAESSPLTYSIIGGADAALFSIDPTTGVLTFITAPNVQAPGDAGANNVYDVIVQASDGLAVDTQAIAVTVTDVPPIVIPPPPPDPSPETSPPADEGDADEVRPSIGVNIIQHSLGFSSGVSQGSGSEGLHPDDSLKKPLGNDLAMLQLHKGGKGLGSTMSERLDGLGQTVGLSTVQSGIQALFSASSGFLQDLDEARDGLKNLVATEKTFLASSVAASTGLSIGYVIWLLRSGVLLTALLSSVPAWQFVNPLLVLGSPAKKTGKTGPENMEDDSLESMFEQPPQHADQSDDKARPTPKTRRFGWFRRTTP